MEEMMLDYPYKTSPYPFQREEFERSRDKKSWALYWEQGTGKTKVTIDNIAYLMFSGEIDTAIIIAPNGVHSNWTESYGEVLSQWETHCPDKLIDDVAVFTFHYDKSNTKKWEKSARIFMLTPKKRLLSITYEGLKTKNGKKLVTWLKDNKNCMIIIDEAHKIKNPEADRSKEVLLLAVDPKLIKAVTYRRVLTGTMIANSMFDAFSPIEFLSRDYWKKYNLGSFWKFKNYFGEWKKRSNPNQLRPRKIKLPNGQWETQMLPIEFKVLVQHMNKLELQNHIHNWGSRVTQAEVLPDLPPMIYKKLLVPLGKEQRRLYKQMEEEFKAELNSGVIVDTTHGMTKIQKMHQIIQGFIRDEYGEVHYILKNPRMEMLMDICENTELQVLIWASFVPDIEEIMRQLEERNLKAVHYYGKTEKRVQRPQNKEAYQTKKVQFMVANPSVAGEGLDLTATGIMIYFGHTYSLLERDQSGKRVSRPGLKESWLKIDMVSRDTNEQSILDCVAGKRNIAEYLMRDYR